ncbi:MAG TPA: phosphate-starvation-inducible PsiE family protein [Paenalcaligenes sp.]|nr:phosphate-starvation-inducible PsiE family protein [Paenalcaligenes sp.]
MKKEKIDQLRLNFHDYAQVIGNFCVELFHFFALFAIGGITVWAGVATGLEAFQRGGASIDDILLLFIYLELGAMVGIYFKTNHMPVRFLIYVAITALTRLLISDISHHDENPTNVIYTSGAILLLALAVLVVRFASWRYPSTRQRKRAEPLVGDPAEDIED